MAPGRLRRPPFENGWSPIRLVWSWNPGAIQTHGELSGAVLLTLELPGISLTILAMLLAVHNLYPTLRPYTTPFFQLSYYNPAEDAYVQGWNDIYFVVCSGIVFTATRAVAIEWIFQPFAMYCGLKKKASLRFAEQAWIGLYYGFFWSFGMVSSFGGLEVSSNRSIVYLDSVRLLDGFPCHLGPVARAKRLGHHEVVSTGAAVFLVAADSRDQHRGAKEGSLSDVDPPFRHEHPPGIGLCLRLLQCV